jgi:FixJ family two-component response regulator
MGERNTPLTSIVDDDASRRRPLGNLLRSVGFRVKAFASAEAFLQSLHRENTGGVVLGPRMRGMSDLEGLRHLATMR